MIAPRRAAALTCLMLAAGCTSVLKLRRSSMAMERSSWSPVRVVLTTNSPPTLLPLASKRWPKIPFLLPSAPPVSIHTPTKLLSGATAMARTDQ